MKQTIAHIVSDRLCHSCGTCAYVCPYNAIEMKETPGGLLFPEIDELVCNTCGLCSKVCPGKQLSHEIPSSVDPFKGEVVSAYFGQAADRNLWQRGQSGGIATALLLHLLDAHEIEKALVTEMPSDGSLRPRCHFTDERLKIGAAQGSKYCPVSLNAFLPKPKIWEKTKFAVVGLPCHFHGISNFMAMRGNLKRPLLIGLICDKIMSFAVIDLLVEKAGMKNRAISMKYRDKGFNGWPGQVSVTSRDNQTVCIDNKFRMWCKEPFAPLRCYMCFDKMNIFADIVLGDGWGFEKESRGKSVILSRTLRGDSFIKKAKKEGTIHVDTISPEDIFRGQHIEAKRKDWTALTTVWQMNGNKVPDFKFASRWKSNGHGAAPEIYLKKMKRANTLSNVTSQKRLLRKTKNTYLFQKIRNKTLAGMKFIQGLGKSIKA